MIYDAISHHLSTDAKWIPEQQQPQQPAVSQFKLVQSGSVTGSEGTHGPTPWERGKGGKENKNKDREMEMSLNEENSGNKLRE